MNSVKISLNFKNSKNSKFILKENQIDNIRNFLSPYGYQYVEFVNFTENCLICEIFFSRYFLGHDLMDINTIVNENEVYITFIEQLNLNDMYPLVIESITFLSLNINFNYILPYNNSFYNYINIFKLMKENYFLNVKNSKCEIISYDFDKYDIIKLSNKESNFKIEILNLYTKLKNSQNEDAFLNLLNYNSNLLNSFTISIEEKLNIKPVDLITFQVTELIRDVSHNCINYILENILNLHTLNIVYKHYSDKLTNKIKLESNKTNIYFPFIKNNIKDILDYKIIREVLNNLNLSHSNKNFASVKCKNIIDTESKYLNIKIIGVYQEMKNIYNYFNNLV